MERRNHSRVEVSHPVLYSSDSLPEPKVALTLDLSMGGAGIETAYDLTEGEILGISIAIDSKIIKCRGHVVHTQCPIGDRLNARVQFEEISKEDGLYLGEYISFVIDQRDQIYLDG